MRRYAANFNQTVSSSATTATQAIGLITGTTRCCGVYEILLGNDSVVADAQVEVNLSAVSALTAGSAITPQPLEQGSSAPAAVTGASSTPTSVTTSGLPLIRLVFNTRATVRWAAVDPDSRVMVPAGGGAGGSLALWNQQPGTVSGLTLSHQLFFVE